MSRKTEKTKRIIDPDDYDLTLDIHYDPVRHPPIPDHYRSDEEFCCIIEAYSLGFMRKDRKGDYTEYFQAKDEYLKLHPLKTERERKQYEDLKRHYLIK